MMTQTYIQSLESIVETTTPERLAPAFTPYIYKMIIISDNHNLVMAVE